MSKRRRMFEIEVPAGSDAPPAPELETKSTTSPRRGPMASAVRESAEAVRARADAEAAARAENDQLANEHVRLKQLGLITDLVPIDRIDTTKLRRDRAPGTDAELEDLVESIRELGLSNPIRVEQVGDRYELIQGYRRLEAYRQLHRESDDAQWSHIPAGMVAPGDDLARSYRRMVDENLVRKDISFAEMAMLAREYAGDPQTPVTDVSKAVAELYASAGYQKRSYIRAFAELLELLDGELLHPEEIPRNLGLSVRKQISEGNPGRDDLLSALRKRPNRSAAAELSILRGFVSGSGMVLVRDAVGSEGTSRKSPSAAVRAKTSFRLPTDDGEMRCVASSGRLEISGETDFAGYDRHRLEAAVQAFLDALRKE